QCVCRRAVFLAIAFVAAASCADLATAVDDQPFRVTAENAEAYKALLPEPVYARVKQEQYVLPVVPVDAARFHANYSEVFWKASAANAGKYSIDAATGGLIDVSTGAIPQRVFGLPFPQIKPDDPEAGAKVMHNYRFRRTQSDGTIHYFDLTDVTVTGDVIRNVKIF